MPAAADREPLAGTWPGTLLQRIRRTPPPRRTGEGGRRFERPKSRGAIHERHRALALAIRRTARRPCSWSGRLATTCLPTSPRSNADGLQTTFAKKRLRETNWRASLWIPRPFSRAWSTGKPPAIRSSCPTAPPSRAFPGIASGSGTASSVAASVPLAAGDRGPPPHCLGHIGYSVVPWKRGRGYATLALRELLGHAKAEGLRYVEITTRPANVPSQRVILANRGVLHEEFTAPAALGGDAI